MVAQSTLQSRWEKITGMLAQSGMKSRFISSFALYSTALIQQLTTVALVFAGVYLIFEGQLSLGGLIATIMLSSRAIAPLGQVASIAARYQSTMMSLDSIDNLMRSPVERQDDKNSIFQPAILGDIEIQEVTFTYPDHNTPAFNKVSFKIKAGEKVAIIGKIGSGKSTIQKLLMALYTPQDGKILIDGVDHNQIDVVDLRSNMGYIPQDANLFYGTIRENILLGAPNISEEQLHRALETSGLSKMINNESMGIDLPVGEQGRFLSGGQRQMVSAARGIANDTPIYLFDEPTTSLDTSSEAEFLRRVQPMLEPKTLILVTHKMHLLTLVDRVIVMDNGKIILDGAKEQILNQLSPKTENSKKTENSDNGEMTATFINPVTKAQSRRSKRTIEVKK